MSFHVGDTALSEGGGEEEGGGGTAATGLPGNPLIIAPVKWSWNSKGTQTGIVGSIGDVIPIDPTGMVIRATDAEYGDLDGAMPTPVSVWVLTGDVVPVGSAANVTAGLQLGDRVVFNDDWYWGLAGVYTITDLGSGSTSWELTRAEDLPISDLYKSWRVNVEGTALVIGHEWEQEPEDPTDFGTNYFTANLVFRQQRGFAIGDQSVALAGTASGGSALALGANAYASGAGATSIHGGVASGANALAVAGGLALSPNAIAIGGNAQASGQSSVAIGENAVSTQDHQLVLGGPSYGAIVVGAVGSVNGHHTLSAADMGFIIEFYGPSTVTIPFGLSGGDFLVGTHVDLIEFSAGGRVTVAPAVGVTVYSRGQLKTAGQGAMVRLTCIGSNYWVLSGQVLPTPVTGVAVNAAAIHAALVTLGLITA